MVVLRRETRLLEPRGATTALGLAPDDVSLVMPVEFHMVFFWFIWCDAIMEKQRTQHSTALPYSPTVWYD